MKKISLKLKIGRYLAVFAALILSVIWIFQFLLLQPMYESSKIASLKESGDLIADTIQNDSESLTEVVYDVSLQNDTCVRIFSNGVNMSAGNSGCTLYRMSSYELGSYVAEAQENGGTYLSTVERRGFHEDDEDKFKEITYAKVIGEDDISVVLVSTGITPMSATVKTMRRQQIWISLIVIVLVLGITYMMYSRIVGPIHRITEEAAHLPEGKFAADERNNEYLEAQQLNEALEKAAVDIRKADQAKRDLIANVSHDLRTPLTMISGYGEMMRDLPGEKTDENIQVIIDESQRLTALVNDLLDLSRMQSGRIVLEESDFDLVQLIRIQMRKYEVYQMNDGFEFELELPEKAYVHADEKRIAQVFNNFMTNAVNYSGNSRKIIVRLKEQNGNYRTEVRDFGEGISESDLENVWDRYYKVDKEHVRSSSGSGIGLAIVREILEMHKARYGAESKLNEGSTFWFELKKTNE